MTVTKDAYLIPSATYLKVPKTTGLTKDPLCDQIVVFIETYLLMQCDECSTPYVVDIEAVSDPLLTAPLPYLSTRLPQLP
jgi:hypothetical protein